MTPEDFSKLLDSSVSFKQGDKVAVAVSGGADSLCLTFLLSEYCQERHIPFVALTVDHGLRKESQAEAKQVQVWLCSKNIPHEILTWEGEKPTTHIQEKARKARYKLLEDYCFQNQIPYLFLGHHQNDQAETFLLRIKQKSYTDGLACMKMVTQKDHIAYVRPFLDVSKERIIEILKAYNHPWIEDPSNQNVSFTRIRLRKTLEVLKENDLEAALFARAATQIQQSREALEFYTKHFLETHTTIHEEGYISLKQDFDTNTPDDILIRALTQITMIVAPRSYRPRRETISHLLQALKFGTNFKAQTCSGCYIFASKGYFLFTREHKNLPQTQKVSQTISWDKRFTIHLTCSQKDLVIAPLGKRRLKITQEEKLPAYVRHGLPALFKDEDLLAVPHLDYFKDPKQVSKNCVKISRTF